MEIPQIFNEFKVWTDDFIIPKDINLKSIINNNNPSTSPLFLIEIRVQEFVQYLSEKGDSIEEEPRGPFMVQSFYLSSNAMIDDSLCEILSSIGAQNVTHHHRNLFVWSEDDVSTSQFRAPSASPHCS